VFTRIFLALLLILVSAAVWAADTEPTEASVRQLLEIMQLHKSLDSIAAQMDKMMEIAAAQAAQGGSLPPSGQKSIERCRADLHEVIRDDFSWDKMESIYVQIYQKTFTQREVDAMIAFYKTPMGQSIVAKLSVAMRDSQEQTMQRMSPMTQRIQEMQQEIAAAVQSEK
jgi:uncharacterized protein